MNSDLLTFAIVNWLELFSWSAVAVLSGFFFILRINSAQARKYLLKAPFLTIRDRLRFEVAMGKLREDSDMYRHYDGLINHVVRNTEHYNFRSFIQIVRKYGREIDEKALEDRKKFQGWIEESEPEVKKLIADFYKELGWLIVKQSKAEVFIGFLAFGFVKFIDLYATTATRFISPFRGLVGQGYEMFKVREEAMALSRLAKGY